MKSYSQFISEMDSDALIRASELFNGACVGIDTTTELHCFSDRASDSDHCKKVPISEEDLAVLASGDGEEKGSA